jgi:hypothetical protein
VGDGAEQEQGEAGQAWMVGGSGGRMHDLERALDVGVLSTREVGIARIRVTIVTRIRAIRSGRGGVLAA